MLEGSRANPIGEPTPDMLNSTLLYGPQNGLIYVGDLITRNVSVVNPLTNKVEFNISGVGSPIALALHIFSSISDKSLYVIISSMLSLETLISGSRFLGKIFEDMVKN